MARQTHMKYKAALLLLLTLISSLWLECGAKVIDDPESPTVPSPIRAKSLYAADQLLASLVTLPYVFVDGSPLPAAQLNGDFNTIYNDYNGGITNANISGSAAIGFSKLDRTTEFWVLRAAANRALSAGVTGDTVPRATITSDGYFQAGPGGAAALDVMWKREAAGVWAARNIADSAYEDVKADNVTVATGYIKTGAAQGSVPYYNGSATQTELAADGGGFISWNSGGTAIQSQRPYFSPTGHRLSLTTGIPVTTSDVTAAGTIYSVPYYSRNVWLKLGSVWVLHDCAEKSLALSVSSGSVYDVFMYSNSGTPTLETLVWTNTTTRATAIAVDSTTGFWIKSGDATRLYVGTIYATGANQTEDSSVRRMLFNAYNRVPRRLYNYDSTNSWTYASATYQPLRNQSGTTLGSSNRVECVIGGYLADSMVDVQETAYMDPVGGTPQVGIAMDSTSVPSTVSATTGGVGTWQFSHTARFSYYPGLGFRFFNGLQGIPAASTATYYGDNGGTPPLTFMQGWLLNYNWDIPAIDTPQRLKGEPDESNVIALCPRSALRRAS